MSDNAPKPDTLDLPEIVVTSTSPGEFWCPANCYVFAQD